MGNEPITMNTTQISNAKMSVIPVQMDSGALRLDVFVEGVPESLFGVSFHLVTTGVAVDLENYESGDVFAGAEPMVLIKERVEENKIIFGISLKRDENVEVNDGKLISFYVRPAGNGELVAGFENGVLSVFDGGRVDLSGVEWNSGSVLVEGIEVVEVDVEVVGDLEGELMEVAGESLVDEDFQEVLGVNTFFNAGVDEKGGAVNEESLINIYLFLFLVILVMGFGYVSYLWLKWRKK